MYRFDCSIFFQFIRYALFVTFYAFNEYSLKRQLIVTSLNGKNSFYNFIMFICLVYLFVFSSFASVNVF